MFNRTKIITKLTPALIEQSKKPVRHYYSDSKDDLRWIKNYGTFCWVVGWASGFWARGQIPNKQTLQKPSSPKLEAEIETSQVKPKL